MQIENVNCEVVARIGVEYDTYHWTRAMY